MNTIVVGGGLLGLSTAYHLLQRDVRVTVVDAGLQPAAGASRANGGLLTPSMSDPWNAPGVALHLLRWIGRADAPLLLRGSALRGGSLRWMYRFLRASAPERYRVNTLKNLRLAQYSMTTLRELRAATGIDYGEVRYGTAKLFRDPRASRSRQASGCWSPTGSPCGCWTGGDTRLSGTRPIRTEHRWGCTFPTMRSAMHADSARPWRPSWAGEVQPALRRRARALEARARPVERRRDERGLPRGG
jgi:hypothetical protein